MFKISLRVYFGEGIANKEVASWAGQVEAGGLNLFGRPEFFREKNGLTASLPGRTMPAGLRPGQLQDGPANGRRLRSENLLGSALPGFLRAEGLLRESRARF